MKLPAAYLQRKLDPDKLPRWTGDGQRMFDWVMRELDLILDLETAEHNTPEADERFEQLLSGGAEAVEVAIYCATEYGDIEPLRSLYPKLAPFLKRPLRPKGSHWPKPPEFKSSDPKVALLLAVDDVRRIRAIWKLHYGKWKRREPPSAEDIAAQHWGIDDDKIRDFMKK